jgi:hypothetical protein
MPETTHLQTTGNKKIRKNSRKTLLQPAARLSAATRAAT